MIPANELRIGNLVYCWSPCDGKYETVIQINWKHIRNRAEQPNDETYKPIPLTEEWLIRFGFVGINDNIFQSFINKQLITYNLFEHEVFLEGSFGELDDDQCFQIKHIIYVHQIQNLYFALTQTELTLKSNL